MRLLLVRHGRTASNVGLLLDTAAPGADLDDVGLIQAEALVGRLADHPVAGIFVSDLGRATQTATPLARALGLAPVVLGGLREIPAGEDEMSVDMTRYLGVLRSWAEGDHRARLPGGEDAIEFLTRFDAAVTLIAASGLDCALVVSHGAALRVWCARNLPDFNERLGIWGLPNTGVIVVDGHPDHGWTLSGLDMPREWVHA